MRLVGMVHLAPLPGSPRWDGSMDRVVAAAVADARALVEGGMDALLVENYGDVPFTAGRVEAATVAAMAVAVGVRADSCAIAVPRRTRVVRDPHQASGVNASDPYASAVHTESNPSRSAASTASCAPAGTPADQ